MEQQSKDGIEADWLKEAQIRAKELDDGTVKAIPDDEVKRKTQTLLRKGLL